MTVVDRVRVTQAATWLEDFIAAIDASATTD